MNLKKTSQDQRTNQGPLKVSNDGVNTAGLSGSLPVLILFSLVQILSPEECSTQSPPMSSYHSQNLPPLIRGQF
jgi:hypothetical protein